MGIMRRPELLIFLVIFLCCSKSGVSFVSHESDACEVQDSNVCLTNSPKWSSSYTCQNAKSYCSSWPKDIKRCCPLTCGVDLMTEIECHFHSGKGTCIYPSEHLCEDSNPRIDGILSGVRPLSIGKRPWPNQIFSILSFSEGLKDALLVQLPFEIPKNKNIRITVKHKSTIFLSINKQFNEIEEWENSTETLMIAGTNGYAQEYHLFSKELLPNNIESLTTTFDHSRLMMFIKHGDCFSHDCGENGVCEYLKGQISCKCDFGFIGEKCDRVEFVLSSNCTSVINESNQMITYSEFSPSAQNQLSCFWTIKAPADRIVKLTFIDLNINCGSSTLKLHDGEDLQSPNIASICGRSLSEEIDSSDNFFTISLIMNDRSKVTSFKIGYKVVEYSLFQSDMIIYDGPDFEDDEGVYFNDVISQKQYMWELENGIVTIPYELSIKFDNENYPEKQEKKEWILRAMQKYNDETCIRFKPRPLDKQTGDYVFFDSHGLLCRTQVGRKGNSNGEVGKVKAYVAGCNSFGSVVHEMMHLLGFYHEHTRADRDDYISIDEKIVEDYDSAMHSKGKNRKILDYLKCNDTENEIGLKKGCQKFNRYDTESIMHYPPNPFKGRFNSTLNWEEMNVFSIKQKALRNCGPGGCNPGQRDDFSPLDLDDMYQMYKNTTHTCGSRWNEWSQWLGSCGCDGYQYRRRSCQDNYPNVDCYGSSLEKRYCDEQPHCNDWNEWSDWQGDCCYGSQVRRQTCKSKDANLSCYPTNIEERGCNQTHSCVEWNSWGEYGQCNKRIRVKSRTCKTHEGEVTCDNAMKMQSCDFDAINGFSNNRLWDSISENRFITIPYVISGRYTYNGLPVSDTDQMILDALKDIEGKTCIRFEQPTNQFDFLNMDIESSRCSSTVGKRGGRQRLMIGGCDKDVYKGKILLQMMHVLGFMYEQNRRDADKYIDVDTRALAKLGNHPIRYMRSHKVNYRKCNETRLGVRYGCLETGTPYDFNSVTHSPLHVEFDPDHAINITKKTSDTTQNIGNKTELSVLDAIDINIAYGCHNYLNFS